MTQKKIVVPVLCSSSLQYRPVYRLGILETYGSKRYSSPRVIPYFGTISTLKSTAIDATHTALALLGLNRIRGAIKRLKSISFLGVSRRHSFDIEVISDIEIFDEISLKFQIPETVDNVALRFLEILNWILSDKQVDFIWHSNISTYLNLNQMQTFLNGVNDNFFYAGVIGDFEGFPFVSGASVCMGRDTAELIIQHHNTWDYSLPWDVALGKLLHSLSVHPTFIPRLDLKVDDNVALLSDRQLRDTINFRCKSGTWIRNDHKIMKLLHKRLEIIAEES